MTRVRQPRARLVRARAEVVVGGGGGETRQYSDALVLYEHGKDVGGGGDDETRHSATLVLYECSRVRGGKETCRPAIDLDERGQRWTAVARKDEPAHARTR